MSVLLVNRRVQHPIGQGLFHTGTLGLVPLEGAFLRWLEYWGWPFVSPPNSSFVGSLPAPLKPLRYIYDCGSLSADPLTREIDAYHAASSVRPHIDIFFLSHLHLDHVNGTPRLFDRHPSGRARVNTVVMPYLDAVDRIVVYASTLASGMLKGENVDWYVDFVNEPWTAALEWGAEQVIFVRSGGEPPDPPQATDPTFGQDAPPAEDNPNLIGAQLGVEWGDLEIHPESPGGTVASRTPGAGQVYVMSDTSAIRIGALGRALNWMFLTHIDQPSNYAKIKTRFIAQLAQELGKLKVPALQEKLKSHAFRRRLLTQFQRPLSRAYSASCSNLNLTSMSVYSGPARACFGVHATVSSTAEWVNLRAPKRLGWLGTGDAELGTPDRLERFTRHFAAVIERVACLTFPHHGSRRNSDSGLYAAVVPVACVTSASHAKWPHPASETVRAASSVGAMVHVTTSDSASRVEDVSACALTALTIDQLLCEVHLDPGMAAADPAEGEEQMTYHALIRNQSPALQWVVLVAQGPAGWRARAVPVNGQQDFTATSDGTYSALTAVMAEIGAAYPNIQPPAAAVVLRDMNGDALPREGAAF